MRLETIFSYFNARANLKKTRQQIEEMQNKNLAKLPDFSQKFPFYQSKNIKKFDDFQKINIKTFRDNFEGFNCENLSLNDAQNAAIESEKGSKANLKNGLVAGFSTGTSGQNRGLFVTNEYERASYLGQILGKVFAPSQLLKIRKIALCLRAGNSLYNTPKAIDFRFFPLSLEREEIAKNIADFAPDILIAPTQILLEIAKADYKWSNLSKILYGAEGMNSIERTFIHSRIGIDPAPIYQATEGFLGAPCNKNNLHLNEDNIFFEFEDLKNGAFSPIISDYKRKTQAIIKLNLDDIISFKQCDCGSNFKSIEHIGRKSDIWHFDKIYFPWEIENLVAPHINPTNDWVIIGSKEEIEIYCEIEGDFEKIENALSFLERKFIRKPYNRQLDFPKRRHIRWRQ